MSLKISVSPKHKLAFELLAAWGKVFNDKFYEISDKDKFDVIQSNEAFEYYNDGFLQMDHERQNYWRALTRVDTVLEYGGRDSGKTFGLSLLVPIAVSDYKHRVLYTRHIMNTTDHSISTALDERISLLGYENRFSYANNTYTTNDKDNPGKIFITGQKTSSQNQTAKLKSLEDFTMFITDEAEELKDFDEWNKIKRSLRGAGVQNFAVLSFNPPTKEHFLHIEFFEEKGVEPGFTGVKDNILYIHTTYKDNIEHVKPNNLREYRELEAHYNTYKETPKQDRELLPAKVKKAYNKYAHEVLGGFRNAAEGVIYEDWEHGEFNHDLPSCYGVDFGSDDPDAVVEVAIDRHDKILYVREVYYRNNTGFDELFYILDETIGRQSLIVGDNA